MQTIPKKSYPVRVRGLKWVWTGSGTPASVSYPVRVRGLKFIW